MYRFILFLLLPVFCFGQNQYNQWHFGYQAKLDFNSGSPVPSTQSAMSSLEGSASVADCSGDLLFYTNGETIWTKNHSMMDNGFDLKGESSIYSSTQSALIVKRPKSASIYYVFTASDIYGISYSVINMLANGGLGRVIQKNVVLDGKPTQKLAVTYHNNGEDIWVATHYEDSDEFEAFKITKTGVSSNSVVTNVGAKHKGGHGDMKFNQQGNKIGAVVQDQSLVTLTDFNNSTGSFSNSFGIVDRYNFPHGVDFSPNGNYMYVSAWGASGGVFQLNVQQGNLDALKNGFSISGGTKPHGSLQLAPDGKIYVADDESYYLGVVNFPNNGGSFASYNSQGLYLGGRRSSWELTNVTLNSNLVIPPNGIDASDFCFNSPTNFSILTEVGVISVLWDFDDLPSGISNSSSQFYPTHTFSSPGVYTVKLTVSTECGPEEYIQLVTIESGPEHPMDSVLICSETDQMIGFPQVAGETYTWLPNTGLSNPNSSSPVFNSSGLIGNEFTYYLTSTSQSGCENVDSIKISLLDLPLAGDDQFQCPGFDVKIYSDSSVVSALWSPASNVNDVNAINPIVNSISSQYYYVTIEDSNGCINNDSVWVEVGDEIPVNAGKDTSLCINDSVAIGNGLELSNAFYSWSPTNTVLENTKLNTLAFPSNDQIYVLTVSIDTCSRSDSVFLKVNQKPNVIIEPMDTSVCFGDSIQLKGKNAFTYTWFDDGGVLNDQADFKYEIKKDEIIYLSGIDTNGCENVDTIEIDQLNLPQVTITNDTAICIGESIDISVSGGRQYLWLNEHLTGSGDSLHTIISNLTKTYIVGVTGSNACYIEDSVRIQINSLPIIDMFQDTLICEGSSAKVWASGGVKYSWSPNIYLSSTSFKDSLIYPLDSVTYKVIVEDEHGCIDSSSSEIKLNVNPKANYSYSISPTCLGFEVQFKDSSLLADTYVWDFGDGGSSTGTDPFHIYTFNSQNTTSLIVGNNGICFDTLSTPFTWNDIGDFIDVFVPNIITPNSDAINDCFEVKVPAEFENCVEFEVYNRWGLKVYDTKEFHTKFCGFNAYNNQELSNGTYFYKISIQDYIMNGFVTIVR